MIYLALAICFTGMGMAGALPCYILGAIYFYVFFTYDKNKEKEEERNKIWLQKREKEQKEKDRLAAIRQEEWRLKNEEAKQARLQKQAQEDERARKRQEFSYVYVLSNCSMPDILKIGYTDNDPILRANELSSSTNVAYSTESGHRFHAIPASDSIDSGQGVGA